MYLRQQIATASKTHGLVGWLLSVRKERVGKWLLLGKGGRKGRGDLPKSSTPKTSRNILSLTAW